MRCSLRCRLWQPCLSKNFRSAAGLARCAASRRRPAFEKVQRQRRVQLVEPRIVLLEAIAQAVLLPALLAGQIPPAGHQQLQLANLGRVGREPPQDGGYPVDSGSPNILWFGNLLGFMSWVNDHLVSRGVHGYRLLG